MKKMLAVVVILTMAMTMAWTVVLAEERTEFVPQLLNVTMKGEADTWESLNKVRERISQKVGYFPQFALFEADHWIEIYLLNTVISGPYVLIHGNEFIPALSEEEWDMVLALNEVPEPAPEEIDEDGFISMGALWDENFYPKDIEFHDRRGTYAEVVVHSEEDGRYFKVNIKSEPDENWEYTICPVDWPQAWYDVHF